MSDIEYNEVKTCVKVVAWTIPRGASTVFMKSISANGDIKAYLEPYACAEHFGPEGRLKPQEVAPPEPLYTAEAVKSWLEEEKTSVFVKDLAYAVHGRYHVLPEGYRHTFLIRKPSAVFKSYYRVCSRMEGNGANNFRDWLPGDVNAFKALSDLSEHVATDLKQDIVIVDADDIRTNPPEMVKKYCEHVGLAYNEGKLHWNQGIPENWSVSQYVRDTEDSFQWMANAINSTGWGEGVKRVPAQEEAFPKVVLDMIAEAVPYYEKLRSHPKCLQLN